MRIVEVLMLVLFLFCGCSVDRIDFSDKLLRSGKFESARRWRKWAVQESQTELRRVRLVFLEGMDAYFNERDDEAERLFTEMLVLLPTSYKAEFLLGVLSIHRGNFVHAKIRFDDAVLAYEVSVDPHSVNEHDEKAILLFYQMMCNVVTGNEKLARRQGMNLRERYGNIPWVLDWCSAVFSDGQDERHTNGSGRSKRKLKFIRIWYDALPCYFTPPVLSSRVTREQAVRVWSQYRPRISGECCSCAYGRRTAGEGEMALTETFPHGFGNLW